MSYHEALCTYINLVQWQITLLHHHLGKYLWNRFHPHRRVANPSVWRLLVYEKFGGFPSPSIVMASPPPNPLTTPVKKYGLFFVGRKFRETPMVFIAGRLFLLGEVRFPSILLKANRRYLVVATQRFVGMFTLIPG